MDDNKLDELLTDAVHSYRPPPDAPLDAIWARVEAEAFARARPQAFAGLGVHSAARLPRRCSLACSSGVRPQPRSIAAPLAAAPARVDAGAPRVQGAGRSVSAHHAGVSRPYRRAARRAPVEGSSGSERRKARGTGTAAARHHAPAARFTGRPRAAHERPARGSRTRARPGRAAAAAAPRRVTHPDQRSARRARRRAAHSLGRRRPLGQRSLYKEITCTATLWS